MLYFVGRKRSNPAGEPAPGEPEQKKAQVGRGRTCTTRNFQA